MDNEDSIEVAHKAFIVGTTVAVDHRYIRVIVTATPLEEVFILEATNYKSFVDNCMIENFKC